MNFCKRQIKEGISWISVSDWPKVKQKTCYHSISKGCEKWYAHIPSLAGINRCSLLGEQFDKIEKNIYTSYPECPMGPKERLAWKACGQAQRFWAPSNKPFLPTADTRCPNSVPSPTFSSNSAGMEQLSWELQRGSPAGPLHRRG